jgi:hypothetical protein
VLTCEDPGAAGEAMRAHIRSSRNNALRRLEPFFLMQGERTQTYSRSTKKSPSFEQIPSNQVEVVEVPASLH